MHCFDYCSKPTIGISIFRVTIFILATACVSEFRRKMAGCNGVCMVRGYQLDNPLDIHLQTVHMGFRARQNTEIHLVEGVDGTVEYGVKGVMILRV